MGNKDNTLRENLAMKIMLIREKQMEGLITFEEALKEAVKLVKDYESELFLLFTTDYGYEALPIKTL